MIGEEAGVMVGIKSTDHHDRRVGPGSIIERFDNISSQRMGESPKEFLRSLVQITNTDT